MTFNQLFLYHHSFEKWPETWTCEQTAAQLHPHVFMEKLHFVWCWKRIDVLTSVVDVTVCVLTWTEKRWSRVFYLWAVYVLWPVHSSRWSSLGSSICRCATAERRRRTHQNITDRISTQQSYKHKSISQWIDERQFNTTCRWKDL